MSNFEEFDFQADESVHQHPFTIIYNQLIESDISPTAFRLLTYMCSKPKGWKFHDYKLQEVCQCGESKFKQAVKELRDSGYLQTVSTPSGLGDGKFKGSKRLFSGRPIFKNTDRLNFNPSAKTPPPERLFHREVVLPTVGETTSQVSNTESLSNTESSSKTRARAPASLNTNENAPAKAFVAAVVEGIERKEGKGEFEYVPENDDLILELGRIDISYQRATFLLRTKGTRRIREVLNATLANAKINPAAYLERMIANDWKPKVGEAKEEAPKVNVAVIQTQKIIESRVEADKLKEALVANPTLKNDRMLALRNANKQGRCAGLVMH